MALHVGRLLTENARRAGERPALVNGVSGASTSYAELDERAALMAGEIARRVAPGESVLLCAESSVDAVSAFFAVVHAGGVVVPVPTSAAAKELAFRAAHSGARLALVDSHTASLAAQLTCPVLDLRELAASALGGGTALRLTPSPRGAAMVLYTSGTTASPKGALINHDSLVGHSGALVHHTLQLGPHDVVLGVLPLAHSYGIRMAILAPFYAGARTVFVARPAMGGRFDPEQTLAIAAAHGVTWLPGVPTMFSAWGRSAGAPWSELRWALSAGAPLAGRVRERAEARLGAPVCEGYGLTEATFTAIDAPSVGGREPGSVGPPVWGVEVRVVAVGEPSSAPLPPGAAGEVQVRGQNVMAEYLDDVQATAGVFDGGWLRTGDLGVLDDRGRLRIVDRIKDLIVRCGINVVPAEVEAAIARFEGVREVAVVGLPDEHVGEEIIAVIATDGIDHELLAAHLREELGPAKVPRAMVCVPALPTGHSGKVLRRRLRDQMVAGELVPEHF